MYKRHLAFSEASERRNHSKVLYLNLFEKTTTCVVAKPLINITYFLWGGGVKSFGWKNVEKMYENIHLFLLHNCKKKSCSSTLKTVTKIGPPFLSRNRFQKDY